MFVSKSASHCQVKMVQQLKSVGLSNVTDAAIEWQSDKKIHIHPA